MSGCLRYKTPEVREHLARYYVLGTLSIRVRRRCEQLMKTDKVLQQRVYQWQIKMNQITDELPPVAAPERVWQQIEAEISPPSMQRMHHRPLWMRLSFWKSCSALLLLVTVVLWMRPVIKPQAVNYMAVMEHTASKTEPGMVITAYKGDKPGRSHLHLQWNDRVEAVELANLSLWSVSRSNGSLINLGKLDSLGKKRLLTKAEWLAIKDSAELRVIRGENQQGEILYRGPCLQLTPWLDDATSS